MSIKFIKKGGGENPLNCFTNLTSGTSSSNISYAAALKIIKKIPDNISVDGTSLAYAFRSCINLVEVGFIDTSNVTNMQNMFMGCHSLKTIPLFNTSKVTNMAQMFYACSELLQVPQFDTSNVTDMASMFSSCVKLEDVPIFNVSSITSMTSMFSMCDSLTDESLNNILQMCINAINYTGTKTFSSIVTAHSSATYVPERIEGLPNYQSFLNAGWTIR